METTIKVLKYTLPLTIYDAIVLHVDKFSRTTGGAFDFPVQTTVYNDVVFRIRELDRDFPIRITEIGGVLYPGQEVSLMVLKSQIIGYDLAL